MKQKLIIISKEFFYILPSKRNVCAINYLNLEYYTFSYERKMYNK